MEDELLREIQGNRPRSRTWPLPQPEDLVEVEKPQEEEASTKLENKKSSRKNAWGNLSYADLITQAITSSPDQRMTLSQIYSWMVDNIPYFKDKGDSTSSAGWKNSIRHNLSLHSRFMRIQNEGNGKSSWWILNHDAKAEKTKRRNRSSSLDSDGGGPTKTKTNKRGRKATKRNDDDRPQSPSKARNTLTPKSPTGEVSVIVEDNPLPFTFVDYRNRSSSNTSTVSSIGRLSPIPSHDEEEAAMTMSPAQEHGKSSPVAMDELMDNIKANLNMTIGHTQGDVGGQNSHFVNPCTNTEPTNMVVVQSMNIDSPSSFVDNQYPTGPQNDFLFNPLKIPQQKNVFPESGILRTNGIYQQGNTSSPNQFAFTERSVQPPHFSRPPPTYSQAVVFQNVYPKPKEQQGMNRMEFQSNNYSVSLPVPNTDSVPRITVDENMADRLPVDIDVDFLEGDIECDVENVLRRELMFNDGYLDFNLDNYVPAIALPEMPLQGYVSGNMVH